MLSHRYERGEKIFFEKKRKEKPPSFNFYDCRYSHPTGLHVCVYLDDNDEPQAIEYMRRPWNCCSIQFPFTTKRKNIFSHTINIGRRKK